MRTDVAVIGAGPYALGAVAQLRRAGVEAAVFGEAMSFWRTMPRGMRLRSNWSASNMVEPYGPYSLAAYQRDTGASFAAPIPLEDFVAYGMWVQSRVAPDLDPRRVRSLTRAADGFQLVLEDGEHVSARRVVVACGIERFPWRPPEFQRLPGDLASHTSEHDDPSRFAGSTVAVLGGGQSALEWAALLREAGAAVTVYFRAPRLAWIRGMKKHLGRLGPVVYAPTDVGPLWYSRLVASPGLFRRLPRGAQDRVARRCIRPAGAEWLRQRVHDVPLNAATTVVGAEPNGTQLTLRLSDGRTREVDHLLLGTGYRVDIRSYEFLGEDLREGIRAVAGYPVLGRGLESSIPGLHFVGAPAAWSFGPIMRFVSGSWYASRELAQRLAGSHRPRAVLEASRAREHVITQKQ
jgi:FAD-dependent urate hydroxylase